MRNLVTYRSLIALAIVTVVTVSLVKPWDRYTSSIAAQDPSKENALLTEAPSEETKAPSEENDSLPEDLPAELAQYTELVKTGQFRRAWWVYSRRAAGLGYIPEGALGRAFRQKGAHPPAVGHWENIGPAPSLGLQVGSALPAGLIPRPVSGRTSAVAVNPNNDSNWLIGAAQGGVWETPNAGATWIPRTDGEMSQAIGAIAFAPSNPQIVYAGTGESTLSIVSYGGVGLLRSTNGGATWTTLGQPTFNGNAFSAIRVHPNNPDVVVVSTVPGFFGRIGVPPNPYLPTGIFKSTNGGLNWTLKSAGMTSDIEVDPTNFDRQYAGKGDIFVGSNFFPDSANGVYRSLDGGETWLLVTGPWSAPPLSDRGVGRVEIAIAPSNPNVVYVSIQDAFNSPGQPTDSGLLGLFKSTNAWDPTPVWTPISMGAADNNTGLGHCGWDPLFGPVRGCWYTHDIIVDPANANTIYAGDVHPRGAPPGMKKSVSPPAGE